MTVSAVCCSRFGSGSMVISPITQCFIKLCVETALQELRCCFPEQPLDILHPSNIRVAQQLSDQLSSCLFLRCSFSAHFFFLHSFAFIIHCLWSLHKIWGGLINADIRHYIPILHRRSRCFPRKLETLRAVLELFVQAYNAFGVAKMNFRKNRDPNSRELPFSVLDFL